MKRIMTALFTSTLLVSLCVPVFGQDEGKKDEKQEMKQQAEARRDKLAAARKARWDKKNANNEARADKREVARGKRWKAQQEARKDKKEDRSEPKQ